MEIEIPKTSLHQALEGCGGIGESERHPFTLIEAEQPHSECSQWFTLLVHLNLPIPQLQVEWAELLGSLQGIKCVIYTG